MLAVDLSEKEAQAVLTHLPSETGAEDVYIACVNSPSNVTLSGSAQTITLLKSAFDAEGIVSHLLRTGVAYHTPQMGQVAKAYGNACSNLTSREKPRKRKIIMVSSVTGQEVKDIGVLSTASYWVENMIRPVRFSSAMGRAISRSQGSAKHNRLGASRRVHVSDWVEIGPHSALRGPFRAISQSLSVQNIRYQSVLRRGFSSVRTLQSSLAELYTCGHAINLDQLNQSSLNVGGFERLLVNLPEYPFNHSKRYWFESPFGRNVRLREHKRLQLLGAPAPESTPSEPRWRKFFDTAEAPWLLEHMAGHTPIYPATGMIVMALEAAKQLADQSQQISGYYIHDAKFVHAVAIKTLSKTQAQLNMRSIRHMGDSSSTYEFRVLTEVGDRWELACEGTIAIQYVARAATDNATTSDSHALENSYQQRFEAVSKASLQKVTAAAFYNCMGEVGLQYGPSFRLLDRIQWDGSNTAIGEVSPFGWTKEQSILPPESHIIHPATLDCLGHLGFVSYTKGGTEPFTTGVVVTRIRDAWISGEGAAGEVLQGYGQGKFKGLRSAEMSVFALDRSNKLRVAIPSIQTTSLTVNCPQYQSVESRQLFFSLAWEPESDNMTETFVNGLPEQSNPVLGSLEGFVILIQPESAIQRQLAELIAARLPGSHLQKISIGSAYEINQIPGIEKCMVIFLPEMESPLLADMNQNTFESLQSFFCKAKEILWVTAADPKSISSPRLHIVDGLARVLCTENEQLNFITCHLDDHRMELGLWVDDILTIVRKRVSQSIHDTVRELDYQEKDGKLCVARVSEHEALNNALMDMTQAPAKIRVLGEESRPLTRAIIQPGSLDAENTVFVEDADYGDTEAPLQPHEVEIEVQAVGVNLRDIFTLLGKITDERQLGTECVGIARRVGSASELQPGDRVVAVTLGTHRTLLKCHMDLVIKVPDVLSLAEAAAIPLTAVTAYHALVKLARLERGESVLIHAGAGGTGQLAIQIALNIGAKVFTTVGSEAKRALLQERYNIPADQLLFSRDTSFQRQIMDLTDGRGVDVVLNSLSGDGLVASWSCIAPYGRFIEIGKMDIEANSNLPLIHAGRNVSFSVLAVDHMSQFRPHLIQAALRPVMEMVASGTLKPAWPLHEYSVEDTSEAFRVMQSGRNLGKAVIHMDPKAMVLVSTQFTYNPIAIKLIIS